MQSTADGLPIPIMSDVLKWASNTGLVDPSCLAGRTPAPTVAEEVARLVADGLLTSYQARQVLNGKGHRLILKGKYRILEEIGSGATGTVLLAEHLKMRRRVAIKMLPTRKADDPSILARFRREAAALASLDHPNVVRALDSDEEDGLHFLVMEYVEGIDLHRYAVSRGPLPVAEAVDAIVQAAFGLAHAHAAGWVHRDVKPGNLLREATGKVKVLDLGLARLFAGEDHLTSLLDGHAVMGTADYIAPEQTIDSSAVDHRADVYSLGATLYFLLAGEPPFGAGTLAQKLLARQIRDPLPICDRRPDVPPGVAAALGRMMARSPEDRFPDLFEAISALRGDAASLTVSPETESNLGGETDEHQPTPPPPPRTTPGSRTIVWVAAAFAIGGIVLALIAVVVLTRSAPASRVGSSAADPKVGVKVPSSSPVIKRGQNRDVGDAIELKVAGRPVARYLSDPAKSKTGYLTEIRTPSGRVLSDLPNGFWFCIPVEGSAFAGSRSDGFPSSESQGNAVKDRYETPRDGDKAAPTVEDRTVTLKQQAEGVLVEWTSTISSRDDIELAIKPTGAGGVYLRLDTSPRKESWTFRSPTALATTPPTPGTWLLASCSDGELRWGAILMAHPKNPAPTGFNGVPEVRGVPCDDRKIPVGPGRPIRFRYGLLVFDVPSANRAPDPAAIYAKYVGSTVE